MEALGWAVMAEVPLVVIDIQRGGPSTGMPTSVEQSDLLLACFGSHGDAPRIVLAPADVEDCFHTAIEAVNLARKYNVPVFILSDQAIATRIEAFTQPDLQQLCQDITPNLAPVADYKPYDLSAPGGVTPRVVPGTPILSGRYPIAGGLEHDEFGHPTGSPKLHMQMSAKRRKKLQALGESLPTPKVYGPPEGNVLLVGWGYTRGPIQEAVDRARAAGDSVSSLHLKHLNPLPPGLENIFSGFNTIRVVEMNDEGLYGYGQLGTLLRARYCDPKIRGINKTDGLTWKVKEILERARTDINAGLRKL
jgi:2-oxoglutarate ferredoxin oxidoreductase subunit alpha